MPSLLKLEAAYEQATRDQMSVYVTMCVCVPVLLLEYKVLPWQMAGISNTTKSASKACGTDSDKYIFIYNSKAYQSVLIA